MSMPEYVPMNLASLLTSITDSLMVFADARDRGDQAMALRYLGATVEVQQQVIVQLITRVEDLSTRNNHFWQQAMEQADAMKETSGE